MRAFRRSPWACAVVAVFLTVVRAHGQGPPDVSESGVALINSAIPGTVFRLRFDMASDNRFPTRGELFMARTPTPGLPLAERRLNYEELFAYSEIALDPQLSFFTELPYRFLEPTVNHGHSGMGDVSAGLKWALICAPTTVATLQLVARAPTGVASRGLGTDHFSAEPSLLVYQALGAGFALEGEAVCRVPVGGSSGYASDVLCYGLGLKYDVYADEELAITPVVEAVGYTFLDGKKTLVQPDGSGLDVSASGGTVLNIQAGLRLKLGALGDLYGGYGRPLTGDVLYKEIYRVEWRLSF